ncbi:MAG: hypothetical protein KDD52_03420 [Bdellovibrionales bacterium]|nr:hypothetical protein [Bdellovibrionales bacterium]
MKNIITLSLLLSFSFGLISCGSKTSPTQIQDSSMPPNIRSFPLAYAQVWDIILETVQYDFLLEVEIQDRRKGYFSTIMIRDFVNNQKVKFRVSGTFSYDGQSTIVKLYKHEEVEEDGYWKAVPSDNRMEREILQKAAQRLGQ